MTKTKFTRHIMLCTCLKCALKIVLNCESVLNEIVHPRIWIRLWVFWIIHPDRLYLAFVPVFPLSRSPPVAIHQVIVLVKAAINHLYTKPPVIKLGFTDLQLFGFHPCSGRAVWFSWTSLAVVAPFVFQGRDLGRFQCAGGPLCPHAN